MDLSIEPVRVFRTYGRMYLELLIESPKLLPVRLPKLVRRPAVTFLQLRAGHARLTVGFRSLDRHTNRHTSQGPLVMPAAPRHSQRYAIQRVS